MPRLLPLIEHRGLVLLALADDDDPIHLDRVHHHAHGVDRRLVRRLLVAPAHPSGRRQGRCLGNPSELHGEVPVRGGSPSLFLQASLLAVKTLAGGRSRPLSPSLFGRRDTQGKRNCHATIKESRLLGPRDHPEASRARIRISRHQGQKGR